MNRTDTLIIGGGQAGLAMSCCLSERRLDHVILERGRIGERWRSERWDSARLLTPNWFSRMPHWHYRGNAPDGFMTMPELVRYFEDYARSFDAPIESETSVLRVEPSATGYRVTTNRGEWRVRNVIIATGHCDVPSVPDFAPALSGGIDQLVPTKYRNPAQLRPGGVLVVGASASGAQLAEELAADGRQVTLSVGTHVRLPRRYRGKDILWWIEMMGDFQAAADPADERKSPPPQLVGGDEDRDLDLGLLKRMGVRLAGRTVAADGDRVRFANDLDNTIAAADEALAQTLTKIDEFAALTGLDRKVAPSRTFRRISTPASPTSINLRRERISSVIWATGFRRSYPWLKVPVLDERGEIRHKGGITSAPGLYVLGLRFQRRRNSNFIDGVGNDAAELTQHLAERAQTRAA